MENNVPIIGDNQDQIDYESALLDLFLYKLEELSRLNFLTWNKGLEGFFTKWGVFDITLRENHLKIEHRLNPLEKKEISREHPGITIIFNFLTDLSKTTILEAMEFSLWQEIAALQNFETNQQSNNKKERNRKKNRKRKDRK